MSVWSNRVGGLVVASIVAAAVAGCGGNHGGLPSTPTNNTVEVNGGVDTKAANVNTTVAASDTGEIIEVAVSGQSAPVQAVTPPDTAVTAGEDVVIVPENTVLLNGLTGGATRNPGDIFINGKKTRAHVVNGRIVPAIAFPAGTYHMRLEGPFSVRNGGSQLTIQEFILNFASNGHQLSLPASLTGSIPANGSNNWTNSVTAGFTNGEYVDGQATLRISHLNGVLQRTVDLVNGTATFTDFSNDPQSQIPAQGVTTVEFTHF